MDSRGRRTRGRGRARGRGRVHHEEELHVEQPDLGIGVHDEGRVLKLIRDITRLVALTFHGGLNHMKDDALDWWKSMKRTKDVLTFTWGKFVDLIRDKYFPSTVKEELELQFLALNQGNMTVREYEARFDQLYQFVRPMDVTSLAQKFLRGLRPKYKNIIAAFCLSTKELIYESVLNLEQVNKLRESEVTHRDVQGKGKAVASSSGTTGHRGRAWKRQRTQRYLPARVVAAPVRAVPLRQAEPQRCFNCREIGHIARDCPRLSGRV
ncbi:uncharacterized protein LOC126803692 [Argentina anserina]|uniref:uncharacterized protein LOC126803692 n=1 Tax=Argentina anserina TaxID=57926 RepID=UPI002176638B|nr:uncharacterized protein LOC126803692 [Potentilla anserina]